MAGNTRFFDELKAGLKALSKELSEETKLAKRDAGVFWKDTLGPRLNVFEGELAKTLNTLGDSAQIHGHKGHAKLQDSWSKLEPRLVELANKAGDPERVRKLSEALRAAFEKATSSERGEKAEGDDDPLDHTFTDC